jgi:hypothetical protein
MVSDRRVPRHLHNTLSLIPIGSDSEHYRGSVVRASRIYQGEVRRIRESLAPRDLAVLDQVRDLKLMSGSQIQAVHFPMVDHVTADAAARAGRRVMRRLVRDGLLVRLSRVIGGVRGGSDGFVYAASPLGHRVLDDGGPRRRFKEPSLAFVNHTLAISQLVVDLIDRQAATAIDILRLEPEPRCWRSFTAVSGRQSVRPDLFVALGVGAFEYHWFIEMDLGTETMLRRIEKSKQYEAYYRSGEEQAAHELFPKVLWVVPTQGLADELGQRIRRSTILTDTIFAVTTHEQLLATLTNTERSATGVAP